jgi:sugar phosphate isomerase/epimerase
MPKISLWSNFFHELGIAGALKELKEAGFEYTELSDNHFMELVSGRREENLILPAGIKPQQLHAPICSYFVPEKAPARKRLVDLAAHDENSRNREVQLLIDWGKQCAAKSIPVIVAHPGGVNGYRDKQEFKKISEINRRVFSELAEAFKTFGVKIAVENMGKAAPEGYAFGARAEELLGLIQKIDSPCIGICLDTSHANNVEGFDTPGFIREAGEKLFATHLSDNLGGHDDHLMPYSGSVKWGKIFEALKEINYNGLLNLEIPGENKCPMEIRRIKAKYAFEMMRLSTAQ